MSVVSSVQSLGDILLERGLVSAADLRQARRLRDEVGGLLGQALIRLGALSEEALLAVLSQQLALPIIDMADIPDDPRPYQLALRRTGLSAAGILARRGAIWCDVPADDTDKQEPTAMYFIAQDVLHAELREHLDNYCRTTGCPLKVYLASNQALDKAMLGVKVPSQTDFQDFDRMDSQRLKEMAEEAPVIDFVNRIFARALKDNASDIHIEPFEHHFLVRFRIDGVLHKREEEPRARFDAVTSRIKLLSGMDIAERRLPQDGRQSIRFAGQDIDLRVSSVPGSWGESLVLRLLTKDQSLSNLQALGLEGYSKRVLQDLLSQPNGVILVTGPTGSGKSTTLYQSLLGLNDGIRKIITIEDPVEYDMPGIVQIQTNASIGYTFAKGLRAILRQDPDIIMVGEIRDGETAQISAQAALTGHLVLSTLHTNSSLDAVARLVDIGLEPFMVGAAVRGLVAQRLVRRICEHCSIKVKNTEGEDILWTLIHQGLHIDLDDQPKPNWREAKGCEHCMHTGYQGRIAIYEAVKVDDTVSRKILQGAGVQELTQAARSQGFLTLFEDGLLKARRGLTTLSEIQRVCGHGVRPVHQAQPLSE